MLCRLIHLFLVLTMMAPLSNAWAGDPRLENLITATEDNQIRLEQFRFMVANDIMKLRLMAASKAITAEHKEMQAARSADNWRIALKGMGSALGLGLGVLAVKATKDMKTEKSCCHKQLGFLAGGGLLLAGLGGAVFTFKDASNRIDYAGLYLKTETAPQLEDDLLKDLEMIGLVMAWTTPEEGFEPNNKLAFERLRDVVAYHLVASSTLTAGEETTRANPIPAMPGPTNLLHGVGAGFENFDLLWLMKKSDLWSEFERMSFQRTRRLIELGKDVSDALNLTEKNKPTQRQLKSRIKSMEGFLDDAKEALKTCAHREENLDRIEAAERILDSHSANFNELKKRYGLIK